MKRKIDFGEIGSFFLMGLLLFILSYLNYLDAKVFSSGALTGIGVALCWVGLLKFGKHRTQNKRRKH